jgi:hypothetical protein
MFEILKRQILSALATLRQCIDNCPDNEWNETHGDAPFSQVLFHVLVYTDLYLLESGEDFKNQRFHLENKNFFKDYYDLENKMPKNVYLKEDIVTYYNFCYKKAMDYEQNDLMKKSHWAKRTIYEQIISGLIRHIQHHAAQLGLRIQQITGKELKWIGTIEN